MSSSLTSPSSPIQQRYFPIHSMKDEMVNEPTEPVESKKLWPTEQMANIARERIRHIDENLTPRIGIVEAQLAKIGEAIKSVGDSLLGIKDADKDFFDRVKNLEGRIEKMLEPSQEYQNLQAQNKRDLITIIATVAAVAAIIIGVVIAGIVLL